MSFPKQLNQITNGTDNDTITPNPQTFTIHFNFFKKMTMDTIILQQINIDRTVTQIVNRHDLQVLAIILGIECA